MALVSDSQQPDADDQGGLPSLKTGTQMTGVRLLGTGSYAPDNEVPNESLAELGYDADWIIQRTGIRSRRHAPPGTATSDLATQAARRCLEQSSTTPDQIDMILVATMTPDTPTPSTACHVQRQLGAAAPAMDLNAACAGFMYALVTGMQFVRGGVYQRVLVVGADMMSTTVNPRDQKTYPLFGDGAGAVLLGPDDGDCGLLSYTLGADGGGAELLCIPAGGTREPTNAARLESGRHYLHMDGRAVFKWAVRMLHESVQQVLSAAELQVADIDLAVFHQANTRILDAAAESIGLDRDKVFVNLDRYGNTSAASIPLALDEAVRQERIQPGHHVLLAGFGAGLAWGAGVLRW